MKLLKYLKHNPQLIALIILYVVVGFEFSLISYGLKIEAIHQTIWLVIMGFVQYTILLILTLLTVTRIWKK